MGNMMKKQRNFFFNYLANSIFLILVIVYLFTGIKIKDSNYID